MLELLPKLLAVLTDFLSFPSAALSPLRSILTDNSTSALLPAIHLNLSHPHSRILSSQHSSVSPRLSVSVIPVGQWSVSPFSFCLTLSFDPFHCCKMDALLDYIRRAVPTTAAAANEYQAKIIEQLNKSNKKWSGMCAWQQVE